MNRCPWCGNEAKVTKNIFGYFCECSVNGRVHNIGCLIHDRRLAYSETEDEAVKRWDKETGEMKN